MDSEEEDAIACDSSYSKEDWLQRLKSVELYESDIHEVILNFFTVHGFQDAAEELMKEAQLRTEMPMTSIGRRQEIRQALLRGDIPTVMSTLDDLDREILRRNPEVRFQLKQLQLFKIIQDGNTLEAIDFAQTHLAPEVTEHPQLLPRLEETMALLAFGDLKSPEAQRLAEGLMEREEAARAVDDAILEFYSIHQESTLESLLKNCKWTQRQLTEGKGCVFPTLVDAAECRFEPSSDSDASPDRDRGAADALFQP
ncbi:unnamed protein product [Vitrella brassicaformis CCMP3155]|uniref:CTLH domain-containing protein n=1 Tax=Vitrella brassicaformis (strain CCMP3155) TaxID=1169540 RepID=A0A0G4FEJ6_VITBC|nr:unnamed protein product [Vitrella brassicaformis CCMP3155]|eukprot:CEM11261.1 unnamed protein product [Vitrella brassicaformis CCMP3155]